MIPQVGLGITIGGKHQVHRKSPPTLGEDTQTVLTEWLGMTPEQIGQLRESGII